jgi:adenosylcobinamide-phosphate synthase
VQLGGVNRYGDRREDRGTLGAGAVPDHRDIRRATRLIRDAVVAVAAAIVVSTAVSALLRRRRSTGTASRMCASFPWLPRRSST